MKFERQYPNHIQLTAMQKIRRKQEAQAQREQEIIEHNKRVKREVIGMLVLTPVMLIVFYVAFVFLWTITPQEWW